MERLQLLHGRGFADEKELEEFLANCNDEDLKLELTEYYALDKNDKPKKSGKSSKKDK